MPRQSTVTEIRLNNIKGCLTPALTLLKELNDAFSPPFIQPIAHTIESLIDMVQNVKRNKDECTQLMENIHLFLYAIINLHLKAETVESLSPEMLDNIGEFMKTLHKIYTLLEGQQDGNRIKYLFRNNEVQKLFRDCRAGLDQAAEVFKITTRPLWVNDIEVMKKTAQLMHEELFELIQTLSDSSTNSNRSSLNLIFNVAFKAQDLLWSSIRGGDHHENAQTGVTQNSHSWRRWNGQDKPCKSNPALPQTLEKFQHRFFVSAEAATTSIELAALIGLHVGLNPGTNLTGPVVQYLSQKPSCLLILDNLETVWEPMQSRGGIEEFLSLLTEVKHLAALTEAAQQTFMDITDNAYLKEDMEQILQFTDNMPLAVDLIAHLSDYEGAFQYGELVQYKLPIHNILSCKTALLATSLAYQDGNRRLRSLMPMQEHVQKFLPPSLALVQCLCKQFYALLELYQKYNGEQLGLLTGRGYTGLLDSILPILPGLDDHQLKIQFTTEVLKSSAYYPSLDKGQLITQAPNMIEHINNSLLECRCTSSALDLSRSCQDTNEQCNVLPSIALLKYRTGDYCAAQAHITEALQLSKLVPNLYLEAGALYIGALCSTSMGNFLQAIESIHRGRIILGICGLAGGDLDHKMANQQAEIHFLKSEYAQARSIHSQIVATVSPDQDALTHAISLLNIAHIDTICGDMQDVYNKLNQAKEIFNKFAGSSRGIMYCNATETGIELREKKFDLLGQVWNGNPDGQ
ncbi:hypothetical protein B0H14DRAFT_3157958, partial [Mycena olivaceomarginata]